MIAEIMAINAAFGVIKEFVGNGRDLVDCGQQLASFFDTKAQLQKKLASAPPDRRSTMEEFFALEKIKQNEEELKQMMIYQGRPGMWEDWLEFQAQAARARREAEAAEAHRIYKRNQLIKRYFEWGLAISAIVAGMVLIGWVVSIVVKYS